MKLYTMYTLCLTSFAENNIFVLFLNLYLFLLFIYFGYILSAFHPITFNF